MRHLLLRLQLLLLLSEQVPVEIVLVLFFVVLMLVQQRLLGKLLVDVHHTRCLLHIVLQCAAVIHLGSICGPSNVKEAEEVVEAAAVLLLRVQRHLCLLSRQRRLLLLLLYRVLRRLAALICKARGRRLEVVHLSRQGLSQYDELLLPGLAHFKVYLTVVVELALLLRVVLLENEALEVLLHGVAPPEQLARTVADSHRPSSKRKADWQLPGLLLLLSAVRLILLLPDRPFPVLRSVGGCCLWMHRL